MYNLIKISNLKSLYKIINYSNVNKKNLLDFNKKLIINYHNNNNKDWSVILNKLIEEPKEYKK